MSNITSFNLTKQLENNYLNPGRTIEAGITEKRGRTEKSTDILIFDRIGGTRKTNANGNVDGMLFRGASHKALAGLFRKKADDQDVFNIFKTAGMSSEDAINALQNVKDKSARRGLAGLSAEAVKDQLQSFQPSGIIS